MILQLAVELDAADVAALAALPPADQQTFTVAKLAAQLAPGLLQSLTHGNVLATLKPADAQAIQALIAAIKAMPNG